MESTSTDVNVNVSTVEDIDELVKIPNFQLGVFLKTVHFLNKECSKFISVGLFQHTGCEIGVLIHGGKNFVFFTQELFNEVLLLLKGSHITAALGEKSNRRFTLSYGEIVVKSIFGIRYVTFNDERRTLTLNESEWGAFEDSIPVVTRRISELFYFENEMKAYINENLAADEIVPSSLPEADRLYDEITLFKHGVRRG